MWLDRWISRLEDRFYGVVNNDDRFLPHLRAAQHSRLMVISGFLMMTNMITAVVCYLTIVGLKFDFPMFIWALSMWMYCIAGLRSVKVFEVRGQRATFPLRGIRKITVSSAVLAGLWSALPIIVSNNPSADSWPVVVVVTVAVLGGGAVALAFVPSALFSYVVITSFVTSLVLLHEIGQWGQSLTALLLCYSALLMRASVVYSRAFAESVYNEFKVREQSTTIGILLREYQESGRDWVWETDAKGYIKRGLQEMGGATGVSSDEMLAAIAGWRTNKMIKVDGFRDLRDMHKQRVPIRDHIISVHVQSAEPFWFRMSGKALHDDDGNFTGYRGVCSNVTEEKRNENRVEYMAHYDFMTGLLNRQAFMDKVRGMIAEKDGEVTVFFIDLDGFKGVNDTRGHAAGDDLLVEAAKRIRTCAPPGGSVGRLGGDEFAIVAPHTKDREWVKFFANAIVTQMAQPFDLGDVDAQIGCSIGIASAPNDGADAVKLLDAADLALYQAKNDGKNMFRFYDAEMHERLRYKQRFEAALRHVVERNELVLQFQPFFRNNDGVLAGFEALVRWKSPEFGAVSPNEFIPVAERLGLIADIGDWVIHEGCRVASNLPNDLALAVNLSVPQFKGGRVVRTIREALDKTGLAPERLELEITERVLAANVEAVREGIKQIKEIGAKVSLDDFGTGYSSLRYLMDFPFDKLKIDADFAQRAVTDETAYSVLVTIRDLCTRLDMTTTVEGIETEEQHKMILDMGFSYSQGFLLGRPVDAVDMAAIVLKEHKVFWSSDRPARIEPRRARTRTSSLAG